jgi:uncharacterized membrane protein
MTADASVAHDARMELHKHNWRPHPAFLVIAERRSGDLQLRVADAITKFAGSMLFVYLHAIGFAAWMLFFEKSPWQKLTLIVSLEAIFLSTFVMIGQNRQASYQQAKAEHDFNTSEQELHTNTELTKAIHELTQQIHQSVVAQGPSST